LAPQEYWYMGDKVCLAHGVVTRRIRMAAPVRWEKNTETYVFRVALDIAGRERERQAPSWVQPGLRPRP